MKRDTYTTRDRIRSAKDALMYALRSAESELAAADLRKLETITGKLEALQSSLERKAKGN